MLLRRLATSFLVGFACLGPLAEGFENMNGDYVVTRTPNAAPGEFNTKWSEYKNELGGVKSFDVYMGPISHLYGQVWWKELPEQPIPADIVARLKGKAIAIVGYEVDQVRKTQEGDVSVPINMAYNHHHDATVLGSGSRMEKVPYDATDPAVGPMYRQNPHYMHKAVEHTPSASGLPTSAHIAAGNGGEYRKSYHGFASPVAYVVESPEKVFVLPMQIDTWNRDKMNISGGSPFVPGPLPKNSLAPTGPEARYSGLLECPLTDRVEKIIKGGPGYNSTFDRTIFPCGGGGGGGGGKPQQCVHAITTAEACFDAAQNKMDGGQLPSTAAGAGKKIKTVQAASDSLAPGCSVGWASDGSLIAFFNTNSKSAACCGADVDLLSGRTPPSTPPDAAHGGGGSGGGGGGDDSGGGGDDGAESSLVDVQLAVSNHTVTITLGGPDNVWFGVGFYAQEMFDAPYAIIVEDGGGNGTTTTTGGGGGGGGGGAAAAAAATVKVTERRLADHAAGELLAPVVEVRSSQVAGGRRSVVLTRPRIGPSAKHANFSMTDLNVPLITALGSSPVFAYHRNKTASSLSLWPAVTPAAAAAAAAAPATATPTTSPPFAPFAAPPVCLCEEPPTPFGAAQGNLRYKPTGEQFGFVSYCEPEPQESVLFERNPTCDVRSYVGGLQVCKHMWSLLDQAQGQPWPDQPLEYYQKYRFYYQDYEPGFHVVSHPRVSWGIAAAGGHAEYDVPKCEPGTPAGECEHTIWGVVTPGADPVWGDLHLAAVHMHCHAPTCLAMEVWNNRTGELLCRQEPVYGGTGKIDLDKFDEPGYILQPPCLWGYGPGLEPMPLVTGVPLMVKAVTNATYGHHGEMAFPEVTLVPWNKTSNRPLGGPPFAASRSSR